MCDGDTWRRLDADFASIIGALEVVARPGRDPRRFGVPGIPVPRLGFAARHSAEADLNRVAADTGRTASVATAQAGGGRAHNATGRAGVVLEFVKRTGPKPGQFQWAEDPRVTTRVAGERRHACSLRLKL